MIFDDKGKSVGEWVHKQYPVVYDPKIPDMMDLARVAFKKKTKHTTGKVSRRKKSEK